MNEWIRCSERLPDDPTEKVLAFRKGVYVLGYRPQLDGLDKAFWRPLPAPPETEEE